MRNQVRWITLASALTLAMLAAMAAPAAAVDGVIEINQARALAGGVTPTDTPGFPVTIDGSGSYRLTGNLTVDQNTTAIEVTAAAKDVAIDLNGFAILGPVTCSAPPVYTCSPAGSGVGVSTPLGVPADNTLEVSNGTIRGMGNSGILAYEKLSAHSVKVQHSGGYGVSGGDESLVTDSIVARNGSYGISVGSRALVRGCTVSENYSTGISVGDSSIVKDNTVTRNYWGIYGYWGDTVLGNSVTNNTGVGLRFTSVVSGYASNVLYGNNSGGAQVDGGIEIGTNICGTDTVCP